MSQGINSGFEDILELHTALTASDNDLEKGTDILQYENGKRPIVFFLNKIN